MERYAQLNAEFQRTEKRDKKAFLSEQCKEIEENDRMRKTRDLFKKIRDTKETFHANMGTKKKKKGEKWCGPNRSRRYEEEVARIHKELHKNILNDPDNHNGVCDHSLRARHPEM